MSKSITLVAESAYGPDAWKAGDPVPEGLEVTSETYEVEGEQYTYRTLTLSEHAPGRYYRPCPLTGVVVNINDRRFLLNIAVETDTFDMHQTDGGGPPTGVTVVLTPTTDPETPYETWDEAAVLARFVADTEESLAQTREYYRTEQGLEGEALDAFIAEHCKWEIGNLVRAAKGELRFVPTHELQIFGPPRFLQNEVAPVYDGKAATILAVVNSGWGDSGNINVFFACDDEGIPRKVWYEASCA